MRFGFLFLILLALVGCDYTEVKRETGYKGKARINPWLAAERFVAKYGNKVESLPAWKTPGNDDAVWFVPASILSNRSFTRQVGEWVDDGGHLVLLVEHAGSETSDWNLDSSAPVIEGALVDMLEDAGIELKEAGEGVKDSKIEFDGESYEVEAESQTSVAETGYAPGVFASVAKGDGQITVLTDGRLFRNRWIGDKEHAALLDALIESTGFEGNVGFLRGSGLSIWGLLAKHLWPVLLGLGVLTSLWLWKNFSRFGPVEAAAGASALRGYEHHLEALGDFQWRFDKASALLAPLRAQIVERGQRIITRAGRRDDDFFQFLAERAELPRDRVFRALVEESPKDTAILTRTAADLQRLLQVLH
jgi:hypothetical protein